MRFTIKYNNVFMISNIFAGPYKKQIFGIMHLLDFRIIWTYYDALNARVKLLFVIQCILIIIVILKCMTNFLTVFEQEIFSKFVKSLKCLKNVFL